MLSRKIALSLAAGLAVGMSAGCRSEIELCGQIPADGCPLGRGGTCEDEVCAALYDCRDGAWTHVEQCPPGQGEPDEPSNVSPASFDCERVTFDHTGEAKGCEPDLQEPDCPVAAAELCPEQVCTTGCSDFFMCLEDGWVDVAHCTPEGQFIKLQ